MRKLLAVFVLLLTGCAAPGPPAGAHGWVVLSVLQEVTYTQAFLTIRPVDPPGEARNIGLFVTDAFNMQQFDGTWGVVQAVGLKSGTYEIYNFFLEQAGVGTKYRSISDFSLRFEVKENAVSYLGEFRATKTRVKGLVDWITGATPYFLRSDKRERDMAAAAKTTPAVQGLPSRYVELTPVKPTQLIRDTRAD